MTTKKQTLNQALNTLPSGPAFNEDVLRVRTLLINRIGQLFNGQGETRYLTPEQSSLLNRQLLVSATQLKSTDNNEDMLDAEAERVLAQLIEDDLL